MQHFSIGQMLQQQFFIADFSSINHKSVLKVSHHYQHAAKAAFVLSATPLILILIEGI